MTVRPPDAIEPLELWRSWRYERGRLLSVYNDDEWAPGEPFEASCGHVEHGIAPAQDCSCGIYALYDPRGLPEGEVYGKVKIWGEVVRGSRGARAQYAYPSELHVPQWLEGRAALGAYGVPVFVDATPVRLEPATDPQPFVVPTLSQLAISDEMCQEITRIITGPAGALLVSGPSDAGKTVTLLACVSVANALRAATDVVIVDEMIRDGATAKLTVESALTGHLVLATMYSTDAPDATARLFAMGIEPLLFSTAVKGVIAQRLANKLCSFCSEKYTPSIDELIKAKVSPDVAALTDGMAFYRESGCARCDHTGYRGRIGIFQLMTMNEELETLLSQRAPSDDIERSALANGMRPLWDDGLAKVAAGLISVRELARVCA
jgi:hypothetical protein